MPLPDYFKNTNAFVEVVAGAAGLSRSQAYYSHSLVVQVMENYGQLKVWCRLHVSSVWMLEQYFDREDILF